jgi:hypothetical protein
MAPTDRRVWLVAGLCGWELAALWSPLPTITAICHRLRVHKAGRLALWLALGWMTEHLIGENR